MTAKKDLKRRVRERMGATGETYTAALARVRAQKSKPSLIEHLPPAHDISEVARREGFACNAEIGARTWSMLEREEGSAAAFASLVFERLRRLLVASIGAIGADQMRAMLVHGAARAPGPGGLLFLQQVDRGHRGVSPDGLFAALDVPRSKGGTSCALLWIGVHPKSRAPLLTFTVDTDLSLMRPEGFADVLRRILRLTRT